MNSARDYLVYSEMPDTDNETMTVTVTQDDMEQMMPSNDDMLPPSFKMVKEEQNASQEGQESEDNH